jgi:hypothetical protein
LEYWGVKKGHGGWDENISIHVLMDTNLIIENFLRVYIYLFKE